MIRRAPLQNARLYVFEESVFINRAPSGSNFPNSPEKNYNELQLQMI